MRENMTRKKERLELRERRNKNEKKKEEKGKGNLRGSKDGLEMEEETRRMKEGGEAS